MSVLSRKLSNPDMKFKNVLSRLRSYLLQPMPKLLTVGLIVWVFMMFIAVFVVYRRGFFLGLEHPENSFLPHPSVRFGDFNQTYNEWRQQGFGTVGYGMSYFPAMYVPVHILFRLFGDEFESALLFTRYLTLSLTSALIFWKVRRSGLSGGVATLVLILLSYPYLLILQTGNLESFVVPLLVLMAIFSEKQQWSLFGVAVGLAAAMKGLPAIFFALPFFVAGIRAGIKSLVSGATLIGLTTSVPLLLWSEGFRYGGLDGVVSALRSTRASQALYTELMVNSAAGIHYGHSLLNSVHAVFGMNFMSSETFGIPVFLITTGAGLYSMKLIRRQGNSLGLHFAALGATTCLAPATSTDYKLLALVPALLLLIDRRIESIGTERLVFFAVILAMAPKPYLRVGFDPWGYATVYATTLILMGIVLLPIVSQSARRKRLTFDGIAH